MKNSLEKILIVLWENDDAVPTPFSSRCSELDWFSSGIKDNIVSYIAIEVLGKDRAEELLGVKFNDFKKIKVG